MDITRRTRIIAIATQRFGANSTTAKEVVETAGIDERHDDITIAQAVAMHANVRDGRI